MFRCKNCGCVEENIMESEMQAGNDSWVDVEREKWCEVCHDRDWEVIE